MNASRQFRGISWVIWRMLIVFSLCGGLTAAPYSGGDGTSNTPYLLSTAADVATLANTPADWGEWFVLTQDVDMQSTPLAKPIGTRLMPFTGVFDGGGHSIKNLILNDVSATMEPLGLFGLVGSPGLIERLRLVSPLITSGGSTAAGALAGQLAKGATVQQCSVEGGSVTTVMAHAAGGMIGDNGGTVRECFSSATVTALGLAGGLLGRSTAPVENCVATGAVTALKVGPGSAAGGIIGAEVGGSVQFCFANCPSITGPQVGGLIGDAATTSTINNCVTNKVVPRAVGDRAPDVAGSAWCEDANNLTTPVYFTSLGWDLQVIWFVDIKGALRLRWMNGSPTAMAKGPSEVVRPDLKTGRATITLDGTQSADPDKDDLRYQWKCLTSSGAPTDVTIDAVPNPSVSLGVGAYQIELTVNDGAGDSAPAVVRATINTPPVAVAKGPSGSVRPDPASKTAAVTLDGTQSSDPDKGSLTYNWRCLTLSGGPTGITVPAVARPTVTLPIGTYRMELMVSDGLGDSLPAAISVTVNNPPTAVIKGPSAVVRPDPKTGLATITLDGTQSSDPDKSNLKHNWKCLTAAGEPTGVVIDPVPSPSVSLRAGTYRIELTVNDGAEDSAPVAVTVTVNTPPIAEAGDPRQAFDDGTGLQQVTLDGSKSVDPDTGTSQTLTYSWTCPTANPGAALGPAPTLGFPVGTHTVLLTVSDGADSAEDRTQVTVKPPLTAARVAASPRAVARLSEVADVKFYLLLPTGKSVSDVNTQSPINLYVDGTKSQIARDLTYAHKKQTVVATVGRTKFLSLTTRNGAMSARMTVQLKTGEYVTASINIDVIPDSGPSGAAVLVERAGYFFDSNTWK